MQYLHCFQVTINTINKRYLCDTLENMLNENKI